MITVSDDDDYGKGGDDNYEDSESGSYAAGTGSALTGVAGKLAAGYLVGGSKKQKKFSQK